MAFLFTLESFLLFVLALEQHIGEVGNFPRSISTYQVRILSFLFFFSFPASWISHEIVSTSRSYFCISAALPGRIPTALIIFKIFLFGIKRELVTDLQTILFLRLSYFRLNLSFFQFSSRLIQLFITTFFSFFEEQFRFRNCRDTIKEEIVSSVSLDLKLPFSMLNCTINTFFLSLIKFLKTIHRKGLFRKETYDLDL